MLVSRSMARRSARSLALALGGTALLSCAASLDQSRREYILSRPHGWLELSLLDRAVPDVARDENEPQQRARPDSCVIELRVDREPFFRMDVFPTGERAPYQVDSGFRVPAPVGAQHIEVAYRGCDESQPGDRSEVGAELELALPENQVIELHYDGERLWQDPARADEVIKLEDVYEAVTGRRSK